MILPPSMEVLEARLRGRGTDAEPVIARRLLAAREELLHFESFHYALRNDELEEAFAGLRAIYQAQRHRVGQQREALERLLGP